MPPKPARSDWKTGEQLEFLISHWQSFKRAQDAKALDRFWPRVLELWYTRWPIVSTPAARQEHGSPEAARVMLQKDKNLQIKSWFNNRCHGPAVDTVKAGRGDLKLNLGNKRKLAPVQAYCSYAWKASLRQTVLERWEEQKKSATFDDEEDPPEDNGDSSVESCIPLAFKLKIAKEVYDKLSPEKKKELDDWRDEEQKKLYRTLPNIEDNEERIAKLQLHERNRPLVATSLFRVLKNLEDQTGYIAQLLVASVNPTTGKSAVEKFSQGETEYGLTFETFYGDGWEEHVERKFGEWAIQVFGDEDSKRRKSYLLPEAPASSQEPTPEASSSSSTRSDPSRNSSTPASSSRKLKSRPAASRKAKSRSTSDQTSKPSPQPSTPGEPVPQPSTLHASLPAVAPATQLTGTPALPQNASTPALIPLASGTTVDVLPSIVDALPPAVDALPPVVDALPPAVDALLPTGELGANDPNDMALFATAIGIRQLLSQAASQATQAPPVPAPEVVEVPTPKVVEVSPMSTSENPNVVEPTLLAINPIQLSINPSQVTVGLAQSFPESSKVPAETVVTVPPSSIPPQLTTVAANATTADPTPNVRYRARKSGTVVSEKPSRRGSIDGAPDVMMDLHATSKVPPHQDSNNDDMQEVIVDLSDYISIASDSDEESHVSSSQKSLDGCEDLLPPLPPPSSQWRNSSRGEEVIDQSQSVPTRTHAQLGVDEGDLPTWMVKKHQWKYIASTDGGPSWEKLLKVYMEQERRLEFTEMGATLTSEDRPSKIKEYFQYAHQPSRGDTLTVPGFGVEVTNWWKRIQPEWRCAEKEPPQGPRTWSYILSGGSKGVFLVIMCLAWWDRAHARYREGEKSVRCANAEAAGITANFDDLPDHDTEWLKIVDDVVFVMEKAKDCNIPTRGPSSPSRRTKRKRDPEPSTPRKKSAVRAAPKTRSKA